MVEKWIGDRRQRGGCVDVFVVGCVEDVVVKEAHIGRESRLGWESPEVRGQPVLVQDGGGEETDEGGGDRGNDGEQSRRHDELPTRCMI